MIDQGLTIIIFILLEISFFSYLRSILKKETKPHRVSNFVWALLAAVAFFASIDVGAIGTIVAAGLIFLNTSIIFLMSIRFGMPGWNIFDIVCLIGALIGVFLLFVLKAPFAALLDTVITDFIAVLPTLRKDFLHPETDNMPAWVLYTIATLLNLFLITHFNLHESIYPIYLFIEGVLVIGAIMMGRQKSYEAR